METPYTFQKDCYFKEKKKKKDLDTCVFSLAHLRCTGLCIDLEGRGGVADV